MQLSLKHQLCGNEITHHRTQWWLIVGRVTLNRLDQYLKEEIYKAFEQPWHAEVFALTVHLSEINLFSWSEWTESLSKQISEVKLRGGIYSSDDYYDLWLQALIELISMKGITDAKTILHMQNLWTDAYMNSAHHGPVNL